MFKSKEFEKYYPIKDTCIRMHKEERDKIAKWVTRFRLEMINKELEMTRKRFKYGRYYDYECFYRCYNFSMNNIDKCADELLHSAFLSESSLDILNAVLYRHKYISPISFFVFPMIEEKVVGYSSKLDLLKKLNILS